MMVVLNVSQHVAVVIGHARLIDYAKNGVFQGFLEVSAFFSTLVARIDSILHMMVVLNVSQHVAVVIVHDKIWFINYS